MEYPIVLTPDDNGTILVTCPDLPEVTTFGADIDDAMARASDAIEEALAARIAHHRDIPAPSPAGKHHLATLSLMVTAKVGLYQVARERDMTKAALGRTLGLHGPQVDRLFNVRHSTKIEEIDRALRSMGKCLAVSVHDAG